MAGIIPAAAALAVDVGHVDEFAAADDLANWGGGAFSYTNPGTGGVGGADDGFLHVSNVGFAASQLGVRSGNTAYAGDWIADGATGVSFYLRNMSGDDALEIHFGIGLAFSNFWQLNVGFSPTDEWQQFSVDFTDPGNWTQTIGGGTFEEALQNADRILFRHDVSPFMQQPDAIEAGFGLDRVVILPAPGAAGVLGLSTLVALRRRR
jgi:hypothetical protein